MTIFLCPLDTRFSTAISLRTWVYVSYATCHDNVATHHELPTLHEFLVDHLTSIVFSRFDMDSFLHYRISSTTECLSRAVLVITAIRIMVSSVVNEVTWHGTVTGAFGISEGSLCDFRRTRKRYDHTKARWVARNRIIDRSQVSTSQ